MKHILAMTSLLLSSINVSAAYIPIGTFSGVSDGAFIVRRIQNIIAMRDKDDNLFNLPSRYESVDSFNNGVCRIKVKSNDSGGNLLGILTNKVFQKAFYLIKEDGKYVDVDIDLLVFKCVETK
jgi:hypothetical protein